MDKRHRLRGFVSADLNLFSKGNTSYGKTVGRYALGQSLMRSIE